MDKPYRAIVKLIRVIESCETVGQLNVANKMWNNICSNDIINEEYWTLNDIYDNKLKQLQEKENADSK